MDLCIFDLVTTPRHFANGSILLLTRLAPEIEEKKIWQNEVLLRSLRLPPAVLSGNSEVVNDHLLLLNGGIVEDFQL